ncbi:MAG: serine/threonine protein kinase [Leptolyngbya sp. SIO1E4]|nr:serine/threonine protein kinase [Leptolyngbya sp. SIO1E4]
MHDAQPTGAMIQNRYQILRVLGKGGSGITYEATDSSTNRPVALKELSLKSLSDWKKLELFEREAQVLADLDHPAIPNYVDYFQVDTPDNRFFYIVQELAEGQSLAQRVAAGEQFSEAEVRRIAREILQILQYLHGLTPPIVHRDIKPQNIIRRDDGKIFLVDFGAVQTVFREATTFGSTVVGTYGYMAPEQFRGQAYPTTDLYSLGATLLHLLTHQHPGDLPQTRLKYEFRPYVKISEPFAQWLEGLLEPLAEDRFDLANTALVALTQPSPTTTRYPSIPQPNPLQLRKKPATSRVHFTRSQDYLFLQTPPLGFRGRELKMAFWAIVGSGLVFISFLLFSAVVSGTPSVILSVFYFGSIVLTILGVLLNAFFGKVSLEIEGDRFTLTRQVFDMKRTATGKIQHLKQVRLHAVYVINGRPVEAIALQDHQRVHKFGTQLSILEKKWLVSEIAAFLQSQDGFNRLREGELW